MLNAPRKAAAQAPPLPPPLTLTVYPTQPTCGIPNGEISFSASGGTGPYTYTYRGYNTLGQTDFSDLQPGTYPITVTDATGATASQTITLTQTINPPTVTATSFTNPDCGTTDGSVTLTATGGTPPYLFSINDSTWQTSNVFSNLSAGIAGYPFQVQDANGCTVYCFNSPILTSNCPIYINGSAYNSLLYGCGSTASFIYITSVVGGTPPYSYSLDGVNYQSSGNFDNLGAGTYLVHVKDANNVVLIQSYVIEQECALSATYTATIADCHQSDATLTVTPVNGTTPFRYSLDGVNYQSSNVFNGLSSGTYPLTVKDAYLETYTTIVTVFDNCPLVTAQVTDETCAGGDGSITAEGSNGTPPYRYSLDGVNFQTNPLFSGLTAGNYTLWIEDAINTKNSTPVTVANNCFQISASSTPEACGKSNGSITVSVTNGTGPFSYSRDGVNFQPGNVFTGLAAGPYSITVKDAAGNRQVSSVTVTATPGPTPAIIVSPASCLNNDGGLVVSSTSGTAPFSYSLDGQNFVSSGQFTGLPSGSQTVWVQDANGCIASTAYTVTLNNDLTVNAGADVAVCQGKSVVINAVSNGNQFSWSPAAGLNDPTLADPAASPTSTTQYTLTATRGICTATSAVTVTIYPDPVADAGQGQVICYGGSTKLQGSGGQCVWSPVTWLDDPTSATPTVSGPDQSVTYSLMVTDANGCVSLVPASVTITVTPEGELAVGPDTTVLKGQPVPLEAIDLNASGFTSYAWSPASGLSNPAIGNPIATPEETITYTVEALTPEGCKGSGSVTITVVTTMDIYVPSGFTPNGDGHNDVLRAIPRGIRDFKYFAVYNRWGQLVFRTTDPSKGWDGTIQGQAQAAGVFVWMAAGIDLQGNLIERKGTTVLIR